MTSKEYIEARLKYLKDYEPSLSFDINMHKKILQDLEDLEVLIAILQKFIDNEEYVTLNTWLETYLTFGIDGGIQLTTKQCDVLKKLLKFKEGMVK